MNSTGLLVNRWSVVGGGNFKIGQTVESAAPRPRLCLPGKSRWYALTVTLRGEARAQAWLRRRNVYSFFPVFRRSRVNRFTKAKSEYEVPIATGYLFAKLPGDPLWHEVKASRFVRGVIGHNGQPVPLSAASVKGMHGLRGTLKAEQERLAAARQIRTGDRVAITQGPLAPLDVVEVTSLARDGVRVRFGLLGKDEIEVTLSSVRKVGGPYS
jgi:transcription antitermination factor NusG